MQGLSQCRGHCTSSEKAARKTDMLGECPLFLQGKEGAAQVADSEEDRKTSNLHTQRTLPTQYWGTSLDCISQAGTVRMAPGVANSLSIHCLPQGNPAAIPCDGTSFGSGETDTGRFHNQLCPTLCAA